MSFRILDQAFSCGLTAPRLVLYKGVLCRPDRWGVDPCSMATHMRSQENIGLAEGGEDDEGFSEIVNEGDGASEVSKVRKRGSRKGRRAPSVCSSVRGSTIAISGLRLRRASQLVGRRRGPSTPVPSWKLVGDVESAETLALGQQHHHHHHHLQAERPSLAVVSARRLAATLWELQAVPFSRGGAQRSRDSHRLHHSKSLLNVEPSVSLNQLHSPTSTHVNQRLLKPPATQSKVQMEPASRTIPSPNPGPNMKTLWKDLAQGPMSSNDFLKVLNHVRSLEEQHKSSTSLVDSLRCELDQTRMQLQEVMQSEKDHCIEVEGITKKLVEERAIWQARQEESVGLAVQSIKEELYHERKTNSRLESLHRRMSKEFQELKKALGKAIHDLERERKARELMEDVCDELAREIGEDKARVEEMKRESAKVREEVEEERKMLQMAEIWREERVQMKLMEAKLELEEKNTALDKLRGELEAFLKAKRAANSGNDTCVNERQDGLSRHAKDAIVGRNLADPFHPRDARLPARHSIDSQHSNVSRPSREFEEEDGSSVGEDDLHSIAISNEALTKQTTMQRSQVQHPQKEVDDRDKWSSSRGVSNLEKSKHWQGGRYQGLQRSRSSQLKEGSRQRDHKVGDMHGMQWAEENGERGDTRVWSDGHTETINTWPSENEGSHGHSSFSPRAGGRKNEQYEETPNLESSGTNAAWLRQIVENSRDLQATSVFAPMHQQLYVNSSPTRHWNHFWPSPDRGSPRQGKGKGSSEMSSGTRNNSLKAKLLEAKLEGQQARLRSGMG
eukprot:c37072_g1_i1 orf=334-2697(+)